jgi:hypothetical protein
MVLFQAAKTRVEPPRTTTNRVACIFQSSMRRRTKRIRCSCTCSRIESSLAGSRAASFGCGVSCRRSLRGVVDTLAMPDVLAFPWPIAFAANKRLTGAIRTRAVSNRNSSSKSALLGCLGPANFPQAVGGVFYSKVLNLLVSFRVILYFHPICIVVLSMKP